jgi:very-short-patch-repair endonuclease
LATFAKSKFCGLQISPPFDRYVLDFYCPAAKLAIELDGGGHNYRVGQIRDQTRLEFLAGQGVAVLRFWNRQVREELDSVLRSIWFTLQERGSTETLTLILSLCQRERRPSHVLAAKMKWFKLTPSRSTL